MSTKQKFCSECGASLQEEDHFCPVCGEEVVESGEQQVYEALARKRPAPPSSGDDNRSKNDPKYEKITTTTPKSTKETEQNHNKASQENIHQYTPPYSKAETHSESYSGINENTANNKSKSNIGFIVLLLAVVLLLAGGVAYYYNKQSTKMKNQPISVKIDNVTTNNTSPQKGTIQSSNSDKSKLDALRRDKAEREVEEMKKLQQEYLEQRQRDKQLGLERERVEREKAVAQRNGSARQQSMNYRNRNYHIYPYVCYTKKILLGGVAIYGGCIRSASSCKSSNRYHFGKYSNDQKAHNAFMRCFTSNPKFIDSQGL